MKKLSLIGLLLLLALQITPTAATPLDELTELAAYFPADTHVFAAIRVDDDYFAALDGLIARLGERVPGLFSVTPSIRMSLDDMARSQIQDQGDQDFESMYRTWMGDTVALAIENTGTVMLSGVVRGLVALSVTDRDGAEAFLDENVLPSGGYDKSERYGGLLYEGQEDWLSHFLLLDDVLLMAPAGQRASALNLRVRTSLAESDVFTDALESLPADEYNIVVYANLPEIIGPLAAFAPMALGENAPQDFDLTPVIEGLGALTLGFTNIDEQSLVMDVSLVVNDPTVFRDAGVPIGTLPALDLDFAAHLPQNAALVVQDTGLGSDVFDLLNSFEMLSEQLEAAGTYPLLQGTRFPSYSPAELDVLRAVNLDDLVAFIRLSFRGMTGLTLEEGLSWMEGDYATYMALVPVADSDLTLDVGVLNAVSQRDDAQRLLDGIQNAMDQGGVTYTDEDGVLVLPFLSDVLAEAYFVDAVPEGNLLIGLSDEVFAFGTRPGVEHALDPQDGGMAETAAYQAARRAFLPDTHLLWYVSMQGLTAPIRAAASASPDAEQALNLIEFFGSMSMTAVSDANGTGVVRFAITLAD